MEDPRESESQKDYLDYCIRIVYGGCDNRSDLFFTAQNNFIAFHGGRPRGGNDCRYCRDHIRKDLDEVSLEELRYWHKAPAEERDDIRARLIEEYSPLIKLVATRIIRKLPPQIELGDLINTGVLGLMDAIEKYDPDRDIRFETYAEFRIRGAILDELRTLDWVPRSIRQKLNGLEKTYEELEAVLGRSATDEEVAAKMGISGEDLFELLNHANGVSLISLDDLGMRGNAEGFRRNYQDYIGNPNEEDIVEKFNLHEIKALVARTIDVIPENERMVLSMYYFDELTMKEIGKVLGITESRISQIHNKAILRLRAKLKRKTQNTGL